MTSLPAYNVGVPYVGNIDGGLYPGKMVRIQGTVLPSANRFAINLQCGPRTSPRDDIALHVSPRFNESYITRNSLQNMAWGVEENHGHMPLARGQGFEIIILCDPTHYKKNVMPPSSRLKSKPLCLLAATLLIYSSAMKMEICYFRIWVEFYQAMWHYSPEDYALQQIAVNGQHYTEFGHRIPYQKVSHLAIDGEVTISLIQYEGGSSVPGTAVGFVPPPIAPVPPLPVPGSQPYPTNPTIYPTVPGAVPYGAPPAPVPGGYAYQPPYGQGYAPGNYPPPPPGYAQTSSSDKGIQGLLNKAGALITGGKSQHGSGGMGTMGTALGAGVVGAALTGHLSPKKAFKSQKKARKKALKYGLPVAGLGLGAYALHKGFHHGSSSSSSSSSEEE